MELVFIRGTCIYEGNLYYEGNFMELVFIRGTCIYEGNLYYEGNFMELVFIRGTCIYEGNLHFCVLGHYVAACADLDVGFRTLGFGARFGSYIR